MSLAAGFALQDLPAERYFLLKAWKVRLYGQVAYVLLNSV